MPSYIHNKIKRALRLIPLTALLCPANVIAASLAPETSTAWEQYIAAAKMRMEQRLALGKTFLWVDESPERLSRVRSGEVVISPASAQNPKRVPGGLIHDWIGAVFVPNVELANVLEVVSDFASYKDYYKPTVVDSKMIESTDAGARFSMLLLNRSMLMRTAFDTDYESCYVRVDRRHGYSLSRTTRVQEIEDYGAPAEHLLQKGQGTGVIWGLFSIARFLERDKGVYIELEAIGLSRDIPASLRWLIDPMVRRMARSALSTSLRQTENAVWSHVEAALPTEDRRRFVAGAFTSGK